MRSDSNKFTVIILKKKHESLREKVGGVLALRLARLGGGTSMPPDRIPPIFFGEQGNCRITPPAQSGAEGSVRLLLTVVRYVVSRLNGPRGPADTIPLRKTGCRDCQTFGLLSNSNDCRRSTNDSLYQRIYTRAFRCFVYVLSEIS